MRLWIWTNLNPLHPRMVCAKFGWNWASGSGEDENVKSLQTDRRTDRRTDGQTDGQTDAGRQVIRKAHLSFQLRWAKKNRKRRIKIVHCINKLLLERIETKDFEFYFKIYFIKRKFVWAVNKMDRITECVAETQIYCFGTSESWCRSRKRSRIAKSKIIVRTAWFMFLHDNNLFI